MTASGDGLPAKQSAVVMMNYVIAIALNNPAPKAKKNLFCRLTTLR